MTKLKKYDVVFFYHKPTNSYVLHRIIKVNNDGTYNICGDNRMICEMNVYFNDYSSWRRWNIRLVYMEKY